jgi:glycosyltransferase involved in cell wall biosynthesis
MRAVESAARPEYSIVVPVFNEAETLGELTRRLGELLDRLDGPGEVIYVDDGSTDRSYELMLEAHHGDPRFKVIRFSRNFGHEMATTAGLDAASGAATVVMDADLQDPPEVILELAARWREGYDVVYAVRAERPGETRLKKLTSVAFYRVLQRMTEIEMPLNVGDFRLIDRRALDAFRSMREQNRYVRGMFSWVGFRQVGVPFHRDERYAGETKYRYGKLLRLAIDGIVSFSGYPLRFALNLGFVVAGISFLLACVFVTMKFAGFWEVPGLASIAVFVAFLGGIQLFLLGIVGEYIARIHDEVKRRPLYLVSETRGLEPRGPG